MYYLLFIIYYLYLLFIFIIYYLIIYYLLKVSVVNNSINIYVYVFYKFLFSRYKSFFI